MVSVRFITETTG